jgi:hypothetical protein
VKNASPIHQEAVAHHVGIPTRTVNMTSAGIPLGGIAPRPRTYSTAIDIAHSAPATKRVHATARIEKGPRGLRPARTRNSSLGSGVPRLTRQTYSSPTVSYRAISRIPPTMPLPPNRCRDQVTLGLPGRAVQAQPRRRLPHATHWIRHGASKSLNSSSESCASTWPICRGP